MDVKINGKDFFINKEKEYYDSSKETIICKTCGEDKLVKNEGFTFRSMCSCETQQSNKEKKQRLNNRRQEKIKEYQKNSLVGERFKDANLDDVQQSDRIKYTANKYCNRFRDILHQGHSLYFYGDVGVGKTYLAAAIGNELTKQLYTVKFTSFIEILKNIKDLFNTKYNNYSSKTYLDELNKVDLLIIDDIGIERKQSHNQDTYTQEIVYDIINNRYINKKPVVYTSNYSISDLVLQRGLWQRTADRIAGMTNGLVFEISGNNKRIGEKDNEK